LTLTSADSYSGGTTISAGTLVVTNNAGSATGSAAVTVNGGALAGTGIITGLLSTAAGSRLSPGVPSGDSATAPALLGNAGTLTLAGGLALGVGSDLDFDLAPTSAAGGDLIDTADLSLQSASDADTVTFNFTGTAPLLNQWYTLIAYCGDLIGNAASLQGVDVPTGESAAFRTTGPTDGALQVEFSAVPEPSGLAGVLIASVILFARLRGSARAAWLEKRCRPASEL
jgi:autotransporter-associated beta strand protein